MSTQKIDRFTNPRYTSAHGQIILIQNVTLIDGTGNIPLKNSSVAIQDGKIIHAGKPKRQFASYNEDIVSFDFKGKYLLFGLIDCHVHLSGSGERDSQFKVDDDAMTLKMLLNARKNLAAGITTLCDLGGWNELEFAVKSSAHHA